MEIYQELHKFSNIEYIDSSHSYFINGKRAISGTSFIKKFSTPFDTLGQAEKYAKKHNMDVQDVIQLWDDKRDASTIKGTHVHSYAEHKYMNKKYEPNFTNIVDRFPDDGLIKVIDPYIQCTKHFDKFYEDSKKSLIPIKSEVVVGDEDLLICGMLDQLFWNIKMKELQIWDWKTNKEISKFSIYKQRMLAPIAHMHDCELTKYSLQTSLYKYIIEKNTGLKIGNCYLVHLTEHKDTYEVIKTDYKKNEIEKMIAYYKQAA